MQAAGHENLMISAASFPPSPKTRGRGTHSLETGKEKQNPIRPGHPSEDLSLLEFKTIEYKRKGCAIATDEQLERIAKVPKREFMRRGINQHTLEKISDGKAVRATKLLECLNVLDEYESRPS